MTWNKAAIAALGPALTTILLTMDARLGWNLGNEFWGAVLTVAFGVVTFVVPNAAPAARKPTLKCAVFLALLLTVMLLGGCSMVPYYSQVKAVADTGIATAVEDRRDFNDKKLAVNLVALCDSSIGAVNRHPNAEVRDFVNRLCGGDPGVTLDQLGRLAAVLDAASGSQERIELVLPAEPLEDLDAP